MRSIKRICKDVRVGSAINHSLLRAHNIKGLKLVSDMVFFTDLLKLGFYDNSSLVQALQIELSK